MRKTNIQHPASNFAAPLVMLLLAGFAVSSPAGASAEALAAALAREDAATVRAAVAAVREELGERAGVPEVADEYRPAPKDGRLLSPEEFMPLAAFIGDVEKLRWWKVGMDQSKAAGPLREPASVMAGCVAAVRAKLEGAEKCLALARDDADFLMWAQAQAGTGGFPFPAARGTSDARAMQVAARFLDRVEKSGQRDRVVRNGWIFDDLGDGGLQFDNGECGVAMFELYGLTKDPRHLESARRAADWAASRPLCPNWNYNSFSVWLLARAHTVIIGTNYLEAAIRKARIGVIPGQLVDGQRAGRWMDPHNARPAYHYIMMRALAELAAAMPAGDPRREDILRSLRVGLRARNSEILERGVMNRDKAVEALLLVNRLFKDDDAFLRDTSSREALEAVGRLVSDEARHGRRSLGPREWGLFLEYLAGR